MSSELTASPQVPHLTVIYLLYNAREALPRLLGHLLKQRLGPGGADFKTEAWFVDDGSRDGTAAEFTRLLEILREQNPTRDLSWISLKLNPGNLGLAGSINYNLKQVQSPYVLTCHLDCYFQTETYLQDMVRLIDAHPKLAAITGKPSLDPPESLSFAQKVNTIVNLMDVLPNESEGPEWTPIGFAEGRCDIFRMEALRRVGFYPESLRTSGEDQILAARLRDRGWQIGQALRLNYVLSTSPEQDTLIRLGRHLALFGQTQLQVLASTRGALSGAAHPESGKNRQLRMEMRIWQLLNVGWAALTFLTFIAHLFFNATIPTFALALLFFAGVVILLRKWMLWLPQLQLTQLKPLEGIQLFFLQFYFDLAYAWGVARGVGSVLSEKN